MSGKSGEAGPEPPSWGYPSLSGSLWLFSVLLCHLSFCLPPSVGPFSLTLRIFVSLSRLCAHCPLPTLFSWQGSAGPAGLAGLGAASAVPQLGAGALGAALLLGAGARSRVGPLGGAGQGCPRPHPAGAGPPRVGGARQQQGQQQQQRGLRALLRPATCSCAQMPPGDPGVCGGAGSSLS